MSSVFSIGGERGWVGYHEAFDAGGRRCGTPSPGVGVPTRHGAVDLRAFEVGHFTGRGRVVRAAAEATLSPLRTVNGAMIGEDFPTFVAKAGVQGGWSTIRVRAVAWFEGGFFGEDSPEHACGDSVSLPVATQYSSMR